MKKSTELKNKRQGLIDQMSAMDATVTAEARKMTPDENVKFTEFRTQIEALDTEIANAEFLEARAVASAAPAANQPGQEQTRDLSKFSFTKYLREAAAGKLTGVEAELNEQAHKEASDMRGSLSGFGFPAEIINLRAHSSTNSEGGYTIPTNIMPVIEALRPRTLVETLGAQVLTGLSGNIDFPTSNATTATWEGEVDENAESSVTFGQKTLRPNRVGAKSFISKRLLMNSGISIDQFLANELGLANRIAIDLAAINGSGSGQPTGILNTSGIGAVAGGSNGLAPTWAHIVELETKVGVANGDLGALAYLTTPGIRGKLKVTPKVSSTDSNMIWSDLSNMVNGYTAMASTQVPSTLDKGTAEDICHAIIFGNWNDLLIGYFGPTDIVIDPYSAASTAQLKIVVNNWVDILVRNAGSFSAMKDALI